MPKKGVQDQSLELVEQAGLCCVISQHASDNLTGSQPVREMALTFGRVVQSIFRQITIVPFRFPTLLNKVDELRHLLRDGEGKYRDELSKFEDMVQMEVVLKLETVRSLDLAAGSDNPEKRGADFLRRRQAQHKLLEDHAGRIREMASSHVRGWRQTDIPSGLRLYALLSRAALENFVKLVSGIQLASSLQGRLTGPWPPTAFMQELKNVGLRDI
jgi:hypothetical protein